MSKKLSKDKITVQKMVAEWLKENGYQGLYNPEHQCVCTLDNLMGCGYLDEYNCVAAYEFRCGDCEHRGNLCDMFYSRFYSPDKDWCNHFKEKEVSSEDERPQG